MFRSLTSQVSFSKSNKCSFSSILVVLSLLDHTLIHTIRGYNPGIPVFFYSEIESRDNFLNPVSRVEIPKFIVMSIANV